jgi:hypothetical protein
MKPTAFPPVSFKSMTAFAPEELQNVNLTLFFGSFRGHSL